MSLTPDAPPELSAVYRGEKMSCFWLLASGIESGWLPQVKPAPGDTLPEGIPHRIAQYWHSSVLPEEVQRAVETMKAYNPGFAHHLVCDESARSFIRQHYGEEKARLFDACFHATMRSDFWRLCDLYEYGGIYVDVDTIAHAPLSRIAAGANFNCMVTYAIGQPWCINNGFFIATPRNPVIHAILTLMFDNVSRFVRTGQFENVWVETGPGVTTMATMRWLAKQSVDHGVSPTASGLIFRPYTAVTDAFNDADMAYKAHPEGNWRGATPTGQKR
ncbi:hypothetical protein AAJCM20276_11100 [Acetobacter aceti]|uniref:Mannosyltransferase n=1 Tax=Acetobacter aceti TaxID=435 RepID=A0A6S6PHZ4_ACEAC|nr:hypothetical protein AAJCM20276_11100 [Acetobacter aceti]